MFSYFLTFVDPDPTARLADEDRADLAARVRRIPGLARAQLFSPAIARDRYFDDGPAPMLVIQLYFAHLERLEEAASATGALQAVARAIPPSLADTQAFQQAMWTRRFPTPSAAPAPARSCSFLVHYPGEAQDLNEWLTYYLQHHPPIMARFPGIREIEIHTRVDWIDALPWRRVHHFQRNKVVFDSAEALERALHSPVREEMRVDRAHFPPFSGGNVHHPMITETVLHSDSAS